MEEKKQKFRFAWSYRLFQCSLFFTIFALAVLIVGERVTAQNEIESELPAELKFVVTSAERLSLKR